MEPMIERLSQVWGALADLGASLTPDEWNAATDCPGWAARDHYSHIIGTESILAGRGAPSIDIDDAPHIRNDIGRLNEQWVAHFRQSSGPDVLVAFEEITSARLDALRALTDEQWDEEGFTPEGQAPYRRFMELRVFDCWFHEQDVREAVDRPGDIEGPVADLSIGRIANVMPYVVGKKVGAPDGTTVVFAVDGTPPITFAIAVEGRARLLDTVPDVPTVRLDMDRRTYSRLAGGRRDAAWARADGVVSVSGDTGLGNRILENMAYTI